MKFIFTLIASLFFLTTTSYAIVIKDIKVNNNKRITKETIITYGDIQLNKDYNQNELNKIIKNLYETNFFKKISLEVDGQTLVFDLVENKIIQSVKVEGVKSNKITEAILKNLFSKDKSPFLIEKVKIDENRIKTSLNNIGYYLSDVKSNNLSFSKNSNFAPISIKISLIFLLEYSGPK